jgi:hypothetical protein
MAIRKNVLIYRFLRGIYLLLILYEYGPITIVVFDTTSTLRYTQDYYDDRRLYNWRGAGGVDGGDFRSTGRRKNGGD